MAEESDGAELRARAAICRERAAMARHLAGEMKDAVARQGLLDRTAGLERRAAELEAAAEGAKKPPRR